MGQRWSLYHASSKREDETAPAPTKKEEAEGGFKWEPIYAVPLGVCLAVPALNYEWYLVNEETQLAACFMAFCALVYKNFGGMIYDSLEEEGQAILKEQNAVEDEILDILKDKRDDLLAQTNVVSDAEDIFALKAQTYEKLNAAGQIKPKHEFKSQMEKILSLIAQEEASMKEKAKTALMDEATAAVRSKLLTDKTLQKACLDNAIAQLKGSKGGKDPVKDTYLAFFKAKGKEAAKVDEKQEIAEAREAILTKLNAVAANEDFFFKFDNGKPVMTV